MENAEHLDVLIVGAGLSGIDAAYWLGTRNPERSWAIFEARNALGGTWDLFRYPGSRSDSDMATLGFPFRPWTGEKSIADGDDIRDYIVETARAFGIDRKVRLGHRVVSADWSSSDARWIVSYECDGALHQVTCGFLFLCSGYYDYDQGHAPVWPEMTAFAGAIVHPQFWPENLAVAGKRVVVIGSGATAVTLVPALVRAGAEHVTMLQRSPTYIVSRPARDQMAEKLRGWLPGSLANAVIRWKNISYGVLVYRLARKKPESVRRRIAAQQKELLGSSFDIERHLTPRYDPWDQRLCLVPDGDLFRVLREGRATIVTDNIERFAASGIELEGGEPLPADIVVTATGLKMKMLGGARLSVDGDPVEPGNRLLYKGAMLDGVPNFALAIGYTNASWTLKCDLTSQYVSRLLRHMEKRGFDTAVPVATGAATISGPVLDLKSGYVQRGAGLLPRQGNAAPWKTHQNYVQDLLAFKRGKVEDGVLRFSRRSLSKETLS